MADVSQPDPQKDLEPRKDLAGKDHAQQLPRRRKRAAVRMLECVTRTVQKHTTACCVFLFLAGLVWVFLFPAVCITTGELKMRSTYVSENSLHLGFKGSLFQQSDIQRAHDRDNMYRSIISANSASKLDGANSQPNTCHDVRIVAALSDQIEADMQEAGLEVHRQTFFEGGIEGVNIWGILRGARASGTESIALVSSFSEFADAPCSDPSGLSLLLEFERQLSMAKWLAKDIVFLATSSSLERDRGLGYGLHAWLDTYHASRADSMVHVGRIRGAIVLDMPGGNFTSLAVPLPGLNGGLPNLDMFNTWQMAWGRRTVGTSMLLPSKEASSDVFSRIVASFDSRFATSFGAWSLAVSSYVDRLLNVCRFMTQLAFSPSGSHAHFLQYNIDAMTLAPTTLEVDPQRAWGIPVRLGNSEPAEFSSVRFLKALEDELHALSNLEERLHQSFYFYFLANERMFVSIDEYIFSLGILLAPAAIVALAYLAAKNIDVWTGGVFLAVAAAVGVVPVCFSNVASTSDEGALFNSVNSIRAWIAATSAAVVFVAHPLLARKFRQIGMESVHESVRTLVLLVLFYSHMTCGLMNFPLAFFSAVSLTPVLVAHSSARAITRVVVSVLILLLSPLTWEVMIPLAFQSEGLTGGAFSSLAAEWFNFGSIPFAFFGLVVLPLQLTALSMMWM
eukprot:INCI9344.1.p1 GENE.INCI9344.1~~INCI9344.1.p1  ORF type:complete len:764 (+),score=123.92 INCI9344.1:262-2292(+)